MGSFEKQIAERRKVYEKRMRAIARLAVQDTVSMAEKTVGAGGRMRVDTGFLRASIVGQVGSIPTGPTTNEGGHGGKRKYPVGSSIGEPIPVTLLKWDPNKQQALFIGWTANYARPREAIDGFLRGAVERWDQTVKTAVRLVKNRIG